MSARLSLNFVTPLPPLMTDIANHSAGVLSCLARHAEIVVWTAQDSWVLDDMPGVAVRRFDPAAPPAAELNAASATFFNFGNNATFHRDIFQLACRVPGIAILHDLNLQLFFAQLAKSPGGGAAYLHLMQRCHGDAAASDARRFLAGSVHAARLVDRYPLSLGVASRALALVTHNQAGADQLRAQTRLPVYYVPLSLAVQDGPAPDPAPDRIKAGPPYRLIVFGFIGANRRVASVLRALAGLSERHLFTLDIYGRIDAVGDVERLIDRLHLRSIVTCHGFVPAEILAQALDRAHLAINLRFPTMGEASGSQLRIWAHGLPALVNRTGWYATLPADTVFFVDPMDDIAGVQRHLMAFHADPAYYLAAGRRGRALVASAHAPETYAAALVAIAAEASALHRRRGALDLAHTASRTMLQIMQPDALGWVATSVAREIAALCGPPAAPAPTAETDPSNAPS